LCYNKNYKRVFLFQKKILPSTVHHIWWKKDQFVSSSLKKMAHFKVFFVHSVVESIGKSGVIITSMCHHIISVNTVEHGALVGFVQ